MNISFENKVALVTGGASGLGLAQRRHSQIMCVCGVGRLE